MSWLNSWLAHHTFSGRFHISKSQYEFSLVYWYIVFTTCALLIPVTCCKNINYSLAMDNDFPNHALTPVTQTSLTAIVHTVSILDRRGNPLLLHNDCQCFVCAVFQWAVLLHSQYQLQPALEPERKSHDTVNVLAHMTDQINKGLGSSIVSWDSKVCCTDEATVSGLATGGKTWKFLPVYT